MQCMRQAGIADSLLLNKLMEPKPCLTSEEMEEPAMTWQLILAAQQANAVLAHISQQLTGIGSGPEVSTDEFKVLASQYRHLSVSEDDSGKIPPGLLFYKQMRIVAPA